MYRRLVSWSEDDGAAGGRQSSLAEEVISVSISETRVNNGLTYRLKTVNGLWLGLGTSAYVW